MSPEGSEALAQVQVLQMHVAELQARLNGATNDLQNRLSVAEGTISAQGSALVSLTGIATDHETRIGDLEAAVADHETRIDVIEATPPGSGGVIFGVGAPDSSVLPPGSMYFDDVDLSAGTSAVGKLYISGQIDAGGVYDVWEVNLTKSGEFTP